MIPIVTADQMRALDHRTITEAHVSSLTLMERAGAGVVAQMEERYGPLAEIDRHRRARETTGVTDRHRSLLRRVSSSAAAATRFHPSSVATRKPVSTVPAGGRTIGHHRPNDAEITPTAHAAISSLMPSWEMACPPYRGSLP